LSDTTAVLKPQLFRREPIDLLSVPTEFSCPGEDRPVKVVLVGDRIATAQMGTVDRPLLPEKAQGFIKSGARNQKVGGDLKPALEHPMDRREIALSVITGEPVGEFTGHLADALALLDGQVPFIGGDRITTDEFVGLDEIPPSNLHDIAVTGHAGRFGSPFGRWRQQRREVFDEPT
jgi:hypothetical protein